ncbi:MAG: cyclic nucleotide-binding domain-containing protein [Deltaproteobacteria bacterium]|nr:cyclic nucleotide-binding domain-containing protein [Deltaproteobacteria bacterium]
MQTIADLWALAEDRVRKGDVPGALHAYAAVVQLQPTNLDARQRVGDVLLAMGHAQSAAVVWTALAKLAANGGYPLRALVALKLLSALEPQLAALMGSLGELYSVESARLGKGVRLAPGDPAQALPPTLDLSRPPPVEQLVQGAEKVASDLTGAQYSERLPPIPVFSELTSSAFAAMLPALKLVRTPAGNTVIAEGEPGTSFFVLASGEVRVTKKRVGPDGGDVVELAKLHEGAIFGEMALVSAAPRSATVTALRDSDLLEFDREALGSLSREVAPLAAALDKFTRERLLNNLLATSPLFSPLDRKQRLDLVRRFTAHDVAPGTLIIRENEPGRGLFILLAGEVDVSKVDGDSKVLLASLKPGDVFGEISLLDESPATATVTAARTSTVLFLEKSIFTRLVQAFPSIREYVSQLGEDRLMDTRLLLEAGVDEVELGDDDLVLV